MVEAAAAADGRALEPPRAWARLVVLGLCITSSWGNGHATTYRGLLRALAARGHEVTFLERDVPWYARTATCRGPPSAASMLYRSLDELRGRFAPPVARADA